MEPHPHSRLDLQPLWRCGQPDGGEGSALAHPWGTEHRPDWKDRGLIVWPRGGRWLHLRLGLARPEPWSALPGPEAVRARLVLRWWADRAELLADGHRVHRGDLFDTACRWELPVGWWRGEPLQLELHLRSPLHDDGALLHSRIELEPVDPDDPLGLLEPTREELRRLRRERGRAAEPGPGVMHLLGHAHLDLAWLWPVADTWQAAERTFTSALDLIERFEELRFAHSTPALYAWLERHRPALFARIRAAMRAGRWEPVNGPWVESDCVLIATASMLRQFREGQHYSRRTFPEWRHDIAWLPDSFGFAAGLPAVAAATGVRWFCTHKLAWNATHPFPHRLFRWRSRCGGEVLALITAPIGTDGEPVAMERYRLEWQSVSGCADALWLPGVGDHGGGPTAEMLEQLALWRQQPVAADQRHGTLRGYLAGLEAHAATLPVWRDELYLELHRGCATSRPDQKRHNRTLERLLREAELARALLPEPHPQPAASVTASVDASVAGADPLPDWRPLLFQQFHDILPGTSIPEVFEQAESQWRSARRGARRQRDRALLAGLARTAAGRRAPGPGGELWWVAQLQPLLACPRTVRLPAGSWSLPGQGGAGESLAGQPAPGGGAWVQLPGIDGVGVQALRRGAPTGPARSVLHPVAPEPAPDAGDGCWRIGNGLLAATIGPRGVEQLFDGAGVALLAAPLEWRRWRDRGEFWDAWDLARDYREHPLDWPWQGPPEWIESGPLCARFRWRGRCGGSPVRLDGRLLAGSPVLELALSVDWRQRHELLRLEIPLAAPARRWAADTSGGVLERPAEHRTAREKARWEVTAVSWLASVPAAGGASDGLAVLLDGPQGVSATSERLGVSLLRAPTWPDPGADNGLQRLRLGLMATPGGWRPAGVPAQARRLREPLWCRPAAAVDPGSRPAVASAAVASVGPTLSFPDPGPDLDVVGLRPVGDGSQDLVLTVQNLGPCRRRLALPPPWRLEARLDGLDAPLRSAGDPLALRPWELAFWRLSRSRPQSS